MKKFKVLTITLPLIILLIGTVCYNLTKPTELNYFIASKIYASPANTAFTDDNFYKCIVDTYNNTNGTSIAYTDNLTDEQLQTITILKCIGYSKSEEEKIKDINGIEKLTSLKVFNVGSNLISDVDLSSNIQLTELSLDFNLLTEIDLTNNINLLKLYLNGNQLSNLNASSLTKLTELDLGYWMNDSTGKHNNQTGNNITSIDLSHNKELQNLYINNNKLNSIDLSNNSKLTLLNLCDNEITNINLSNLSNLRELELNRNLLESIDISDNINLTKLYLVNNKLKTIDINNNQKLNYLYVDGNQLTYINTNNNPKLDRLYAKDNLLTSVDVSGATKLEGLSLSNNQLTTIDVSKNTNLDHLHVRDNKIEQIDVSNNSLLRTLEIDNNLISELDLSNNINLKTLWASGNQLESVDLSNNTLLETLNLNSNNISSIDLTNNSNLKSLNIYNNSLERLDLSNNQNITTLVFSGNPLNTIVLFDGYDTSKKLDFSTYKEEKINQTTINYGNHRIIKPVTGYKFYMNNYVLIKEVVSVEEFIQKLRLNNLTAKVYDGETEITTGTVQNDYRLKIYDNDNVVQDISIKVLVSEYFEDETLYNCVVDAYNRENDTTLPYSTNLTLEQLQSIKNLHCGDIVKNPKGIEVLTGLTRLSMWSANFSKIDLSNNILLEELSLDNDYLGPYSYQLETIDLQFNENLNNVSITSDKLYVINGLSKLNKLKNLELDAPKISSINISNNLNLELFYLVSDEIETVDVSKNILLKELLIGSQKLKKLDISKNINLTYLEIGSLVLDEIDLSNNLQLEYLWLYGGKLSSVDLQYNLNLEYLYLGLPGLKNINLENNNKLIQLGIESNSLTGLDLSNNVLLEHLSIYNTSFINENELYGYKSENIVIPEYTKLKLFDGKTTTYKAQAALSNNLMVSDHGVMADIGGIYNVEAQYQHDIQNVNNTYSVIYAVKIIEATSDKYIIDEGNNYIYTGTDIDETTILNNINLNYGGYSIENNKLLIKYNDELVKSFDIKNINFGQFKSFKKHISVLEETTYEDFISNITLSNELTYKIFNDEVEITEGSITPGMNLKVYYNEEVIDEYTITDEYLEFSETLTINEEQGLIENLNVGQTVEDIKENINTSGTVKIVDQENNEVIDSIVGTGYKVVIELSKKTIEYTLIVNGDITGDGKIRMSDVMKGANYVLDNSTITEQFYIKAGDVTGDSKIKMSDVMKLANAVLEGGKL